MAQTASESEGNTLQEVIVTAQKREERLQDVPISIAVLDAKTLDQQPGGGTLEALAQVPGISEAVSDAGGMTQISIRGVSPAVPFGDGSTTVGYYVDGIPFALGRSAAVPNTNDFDMARIEVLRGPQGTLYGATALNGVVRLVTNDADPTQFEAKARVGTAATDGGSESYQGDAAVNIPIIQDKLAARLVVGDDYGGGWIDQPHLDKTDANWTNARTVRLKVDIRPIDDLKIDLTAWDSYYKENAGSFGINGIQARTYNATPSTTHFDAFNGRIVYDLPFATLSSSTSYMNFNQDIYTDADNGIAPLIASPAAVLYSHLPAIVLTEEFLINSRNSGDWRWQVGAFYRDAHNDTYQTLPIAFGTDHVASRDKSESEAVFGQATRTFDNDHFEVTGGLRYFTDDYGTETLDLTNSAVPFFSPHATASAVTPRLVLAWLPNQYTNIYASYSVGFRSGLEQTPLALEVESNFPPARPDKLYNYEVGAKGSLWGGVVTYDASVFYIKWKDIQQNGQLEFCNPACVPVGGTINGTSASGPGFDLSLALQLTRGLSLGVAFSENNLTEDANVYPSGVGVGPNNGAVYVKGDRTPFSAQYTANAHLDYGWALSDRFDARFEISGDYRSSELIILPPAQGSTLNTTAYTICNGGNFCYFSNSPTNLNARFEIANHHNQTLSLYATNLTNWSGYTVPPTEQSTEIRERPRTVGIQFQMTY